MPDSLYHPIQLNNQVSLPGNLFLAPMAGFTDKAFRDICVQWDCELAYTEMVSSEGVIRDSVKSINIAERSEYETIFAIQLFGHDPETMAKSTEWCEQLGPAFIDINCGCPVPKVIKSGSGSALMKNPENIAAIVKAMTNVTDIPITVKLRSGWDTSSINFLECADAAVSNGAALVGLHPRTRVQGYAGNANWDHIKTLKKHISVPVIGSGDLFTPEDTKRMIEYTGCDGVMVARGAVGNPFIFRQAKELLSGKPMSDISIEERVEAAKNHIDRAIHYKPEWRALKEIRKQLCGYVKGLPGAAQIRNQVVTCTSREAYFEVFDSVLKYRDEEEADNG